MKQPLPLALRTVMDGRLTMRQAHRLWAYAVYGVSPADDAESQAVGMNYCHHDLPTCLFSGPLNDPDNAWIDFQAFVGLAAMHHVDLGIDFIHTSSADMAAAFSQAYAVPPPTLVAPVATLDKPKGKPGRKPDPVMQQAVDMALELEGQGQSPNDAAQTAAGQFNVKADSVLRRTRERRNSQ